MQESTTDNRFGNGTVSHPLDPEDAAIVAAMRLGARSSKGLLKTVQARGGFDALMEGVLSRKDVKFEPDTIGGIAGIWVDPLQSRAGRAILHIHGGWFNFGTAQAYRHLVAHLAARAGVCAFIPNYRLAPEHPFPSAVDDVVACYRGLRERGIHRIAVTGDSAGGNLALTMATSARNDADDSGPEIVGTAVFSPITDLSVSGDSYMARAEADPYFTRSQAEELIRAYLGSADAKQPLASPLFADLSSMPSVRIHVGDDEVLLDDSRRFVVKALLAGVDARLDVWMGMPHGFVGSVGKLKASDRALEAVSAFLAERLS